MKTGSEITKQLFQKQLLQIKSNVPVKTNITATTTYSLKAREGNGIAFATIRVVISGFSEDIFIFIFFEGISEFSMKSRVSQ